LAKFKANTKVDLLITDLNMPGMNGIDFIKEVRKLPGYKFIADSVPDHRIATGEARRGQGGRRLRLAGQPATADELLNTIKLVLH